MPNYDIYPAIDENYDFPPIVRQSIANSTEVRAVVVNSVTPIVEDITADVISNDDTVVQAAENAIAGVLGDKLDRIEDVILDTSPRVLSIDIPFYAEVNLSFDFRRTGGILLDGGAVGITPQNTETVIWEGNGAIDLSYDFRRSQPSANDRGLTPQEILDEWSTRMSLSGASNTLTCIGDSMTTDFGDLGTSVTKELAEILGVTGNDRGYIGDTPYQIGFRMGVSPFRITVSGGVIPASGSVSAELDSPVGWFRANDFECILMDRLGKKIKVLLKQTAGSNPDQPVDWTVSQINGSASAQIVAKTRILPITGTESLVLSAPTVLWVGRNDINLDRTVEVVSAFITQHRDPMNRIMVRPIFNRSTEPAGSSGYNAVMDTNAAIKNVAGLNFYDDRSVLISHGHEILGIQKTADDIQAISEDRIPPSFMMDTTHLNASGRLALARIDAAELVSRNWFLN